LLLPRADSSAGRAPRSQCGGREFDPPSVHHFGRIQLIRKQSSAGGEHFARLEINRAAAIKKLLLITSNPQLDELFANLP